MSSILRTNNIILFFVRKLSRFIFIQDKNLIIIKRLLHFLNSRDFATIEKLGRKATQFIRHQVSYKCQSVYKMSKKMCLTKMHNSKLSENSSFKFHKEHPSSSFLLLRSITAYFFFNTFQYHFEIVSLKLDKRIDNFPLNWKIYSTVFLLEILIEYHSVYDQKFTMAHNIVSRYFKSRIANVNCMFLN